MYEMRQNKIKEMKQKRWFYYALLAVAVFLYSQGSSIIKTNMGYALSEILISFILHTSSLGNLIDRIFKIKSPIIASIAMLVVLSVISVISYFNQLKFLYIVLLNFAAIAIHFLVAVVCYKLKTGE